MGWRTPKEFGRSPGSNWLATSRCTTAQLAALVILIHFALTQTSWSLFAAVGDNANGNPGWYSSLQTKILAYVICGVMAAIGGTLCSRIGFVTPMSGNGYETAIAACAPWWR